MVQSLFVANARVREFARERPELRGMGCVIVGALVVAGWLHVVNVGDARAYVSSREGLARLTVDHTSIALLVKLGELTEDQARRSARRGELYQAIGGGYGLNPAYRQHALRPGDRVLLCSDGLTDPVPEEELQRLVGVDTSVRDLCDVLIERADAAGSGDDVTVVVMEAGG
jgi:protein phosphatase